MKKILLAAGFICAVLTTVSAQDLKTPAPSSTQTVKQDFGLGSVELSYSRPNVKGRKIFGDLVPYSKVWRTGANDATVFTFSDDVNIAGTAVKAGKYGLLTIPDAAEWTVIITKQTDVTSPAAYKQDQDVVRVKVKPEQLPFPVETFSINFMSVKPNAMDVVMAWNKTSIRFPMTTDVDNKVMGQIKDLMNSDNRPYFAAAMYYMNNEKDLNQALAWFDKAAELNPDAFWVHHQRANCLAKLGKKADAIAAANKSIELATKAKNDDYVTLNEKLLATLK
ncbi:MAG: DUF2911 domain-containing protein [Ginsengibacter sp.]